MKKVLPLLGLLLVLAAVIAFKWWRVGGVGERFPASRAAELAPGDAIAFFSLPDLDRTGTRWPNSDLQALAQKLGWKPGGERAGVAALQKYFHPDLMLLLGMLPEIEKAAPAGFFLAATNSAEESLPKVVGGFSYRGKRTDVESVVRAVKAHLFARWPGAKSELFSHGGIEIETLASIEDPVKNSTPKSATGASIPPSGTVPLPALFLAYRDDWLFFATDRALLTQALDRYSRKAGASPSLAQNPHYAECRKHEIPEADLIVWEPWNRLGGEFIPHWPGLSIFWGTQENPDRDARNLQLRKLGLAPAEPLGIQTDVQAAHYSARLDGASRLYVLTAKPPVAVALSNRAPALAPPYALAYGAINLDALRGREALMGRVFLRSGGWSKIAAALEQRKLSWDDLRAAFGPEVNMIFFESFYRINLIVAVDVRDAAKAKTIAETIIAGNELSWVETDGERWDLMQKYEVPAGIVLTKSHLITGASSPEGFDVALRSKRAGQRASAEKGSATPMASGPAPAQVASFYFDAGRIVPTLPPQRSFYAGLTLSLPWYIRQTPFTGDELPFGQFKPKLSPGTIRIQPEGSGWLLESDLSILGDYVARQLVRDAL